jgi:hypothetical protein
MFSFDRPLKKGDLNDTSTKRKIQKKTYTLHFFFAKITTIINYYLNYS